MLLGFQLNKSSILHVLLKFAIALNNLTGVRGGYFEADIPLIELNTMATTDSETLGNECKFVRSFGHVLIIYWVSKLASDGLRSIVL